MVVRTVSMALSSRAIFVSKTCVINTNRIIAAAKLVLLVTSLSMETVFHIPISVSMVMFTKAVLLVSQGISHSAVSAENSLIIVLSSIQLSLVFSVLPITCSQMESATEPFQTVLFREH